MNLTQIIAETGKRVRLGKTRDDQLTNAQVKPAVTDDKSTVFCDSSSCFSPNMLRNRKKWISKLV